MPGLWGLADLVTPMAIRVAATLRLADRMPATSEELAAGAGADPTALRRMLDHLAWAGVLTRDDAGRWDVTAIGAELREDHPEGLGRMLDTGSAVGRADLSLIHLEHSIRTGDAAFPLLYDDTFWDDLATAPGRGAGYDTQMGIDVAADASAIAEAYDWGSLGHLIDVGGGDGSLLAAVLRAHPDLRGTVFDQPATAARAALTLAPLGDRADAVGGDFFAAIPAGAGGYALSAIIHDWDDASAIRILRGCADAAGPDGRVFVIEKIAGNEINTGMDLRMLAYFGGRERGVSELTRLAEAAGLKAEGARPAGTLTILELRPR